MGLIQKITTIITFILIVPIITILIIYFNSYQKSLLNDAEKRLDGMLNAMDTTINSNLDSIENVFAQLSYRQEFSYFLNDRNVLSEREKNYFISSIHQELMNIRYLYPNKFYHISIYSSNNQVSDQINWQFSLTDLNEVINYKDILESTSNIVFGNIQYSKYASSNINLKDLNLKYTDTLVLPAYLKVHDLNTKELIGIISIEMRVDKFVNSDVLKEIDKNYDYLLIDKNNKVIYQTGKFHPTVIENIKISDSDKFTEMKIGNKTYMITHSTNQRSGLTIASLIAKDTALGFAYDMMIRIITLVIFGIFFIIVFVYWIIRRTLKRLLILNEKIKEIEAGNFDVYIPENIYNDEIANIGRSINSMASRLDGLIRSTVEKEQAKNEAEMRALQAQINPHFLYNTLENMRMQCEMDEYYTLGDSLEALGHLFRYSIKWGSNEVPFEMEWNNLNNYFSIMKMRFGEDVDILKDCEPGLEDIIIPKMILQPLVENCFNHGFKNILPPWTISVKALKLNHQLFIIIQDNGSGIDSERLEYIRACMLDNKSIESDGKSRDSIGIINVKKRIEMICKKGSHIDIESETGKGTKIIISILLEEESHV